jgi:hypothetical protein
MNTEIIPNLFFNGLSIDIDIYHKLVNEYNDEQIKIIMYKIDIIKDTISKLLINIQSENKSDDKYRLRNRNVMCSIIETKKTDIINNYITYQSKMLDYYNRLDILKSNCIQNTEYFIEYYKDTKNQLDTLNLEYDKLTIDSAKINTYHIENENKLNSHCIEQSIKVSALISELSDVKTQRDFLKGIVNKGKESINELEIKNKQIVSELEMNNLNNINNKNKMDNYEYEIQKILDDRKYIIANNTLLRGEFNELQKKLKETLTNLEFHKLKTENVNKQIDKLQNYLSEQEEINIKNMSDISDMTEIIKKKENDKKEIIIQALELLPSYNWDEKYGFISKEYDVINEAINELNS